MPPFFVFAGYDYYPNGGWEDFVGTAETVKDALVLLANSKAHDWWHIVDLATMKKVEEGHADYR